MYFIIQGRGSVLCATTEAAEKRLKAFVDNQRKLGATITEITEERFRVDYRDGAFDIAYMSHDSEGAVIEDIAD